MSELSTKQALINLGGNLWEKGGHIRVYIDGFTAKKFFNNENAHFGKRHTIYYDTVKKEFRGTNKREVVNLNILLEELNK